MRLSDEQKAAYLEAFPVTVRRVLLTCNRCIAEAKQRQGLPTGCPEWGGFGMPMGPGGPQPLVCAKGLENCGVQRLWMEAQGDADVFIELSKDGGDKRLWDANDCLDAPYPERKPRWTDPAGDGTKDMTVTVDDTPLTPDELRAASAEVVAQTHELGYEPPVVRMRGKGNPPSEE